MENIEKVAEMAFHGVTYIIKINSTDDILNIEIEDKETGNIWKNSFSATYIEEITTKTGNYKKFGVFGKMLISSITKASDSVFLDILTSQDLEMLKARKKPDQRPSVNPDRAKNMKRYMILTYSVEYDKVHYPLPLNFEENPDVGVLKNTIRRLRMEIEDLKSGQNRNVNQSTDGFFVTGNGEGHSESKAELTALKVENESLKEKVKRLEENGGNSATTKKLGAVEYDNVLKSKMELEEELANLKKDYVRDIKRLKAKLDDTEVQLEKTKEELEHVKQGAANDLGNSKGTRSKEDEFEIGSLKKTMARYQKEIETLNQELDTLRNSDRKQKARIRQLETELESALKRASYSRGSNISGGSTYNRSRENSPNNSASKRFNSVPSKNYSPGFNKYDKKTTPSNRGTPTNTRTLTNTRGTPTNTRGTPTRPSPSGTPTRGLYGSNSKTYGLSGSGSNLSNLRQRGNSPGSRVTNLSGTSNSSTGGGTGAGSANRKTTPQRTNQRDTFGGYKKSPQPSRNLSPSNKPNTYSPSPSRLSPGGGNKFGLRYNNYMPNNAQKNNLGNSLRNKSGTSNMSDSEDELANSRRMQGGKGPTANTKPSYMSGIGNTRSNVDVASQQKLKENIQDFKESQNSKASERLEKEALENSIETADINDRINNLQALLKKVKS